MTKEKSHILKIDILRGVAILGVFFYHSQLMLYPNFEIKDYSSNGIIITTGFKSILLNFSPSAFGWTGVQLFLIISGFLIHLGYLYNNENIKTSIFYSKRFWRIYPPYLFVLLFFCFSTNAIGYFLFSKPGLYNLGSHLLFLHNLSDKTFYSINPSFWSLALEMQLYLIYPLLLFSRKKIGMRNTLICLIALSFLFLTIGIIFKDLGILFSFDRSVIKFWFIWGAGAFLAEKYFKGEKIFPKGTVYIIVFGFVATLLSKSLFYSSYLTVYLATLTWIAFFEWFLIKEIVLEKYVYKIIATIGICSYSIYLIHQPYLNDLLRYFEILNYKQLSQFYPIFKILKLIPTFIIIFLISYSLYLFIELPSVKLGNLIRKSKVLTNTTRK